MRREVQGDDVGMGQFEEDFLFGMEVHQLVLFKDLLFAHDLQGVHFISASEFDQFDSSEGAVAESGEHFEVVFFEFAQDLFAVFLEDVHLALLHRYR